MRRNTLEPPLCCMASRGMLIVAVVICSCELILAEEYSPKVPVVFVTDVDGMSRQVPNDELYHLERDVQTQVARDGGPSEVVVFATSRVRDWAFAHESRDAVRQFVAISIFDDVGKVEWVTEFGDKRSPQEDVPKETIRSIQRFIADNSVDRLPPLGGVRESDGFTIVGGTAYVYLHVTREQGHRVFIHKQRMELGDEATKKYAKVVAFLEQFRKQHSTD